LKLNGLSRALKLKPLLLASKFHLMIATLGDGLADIDADGLCDALGELEIEADGL